MNNELQKRYGLPVAISMVIGIVIGSGVFFKAEKVLSATGGDLPLGILAWVIGGLIMIISAATFAVMATKYDKANGLVGYAEATIGPKYGYLIGWFMATIYYPTLTSVLAWVSARYTFVLLGSDDITGGGCMALGAFYLIANYALNSLAPVLAGKFQVSTTVIKLIPLMAMAVVGIIVGVSNGMLVENFTTVPTTEEILGVNPNYAPVATDALLTAVVGTAFAYEGWIIATSIHTELRDPKKNLPRALVVGTLVIMAVYILYYIGIAGAATNLDVLAGAETGAKLAFENIFGSIGGVLIYAFVVISCLGTLNGLMLGCCRGFYALAEKNQGFKPEALSKVDAATNMPTNATITGLLFAGFWYMYFYGANLTASWFGPFSFDTSEIPIVTLYALYVPMYFALMAKAKDLGVFSRIILPVAATISAGFMVYAAFVSHGAAMPYYLIVFAVVMAVGLALYKKEKK